MYLSHKIFSFFILQFVLFCSITSYSQKYDFKIYDHEDGFNSPENNFVIFDKHNFLWSSGTDGLTRFDGKNFINFYENLGINDAQINCIAEKSNNEIICGTRKGVSIFDGEKLKKIGFKLSKNSNWVFQHVRCLYVTKNDEIYAGTFEGLFKFNKSKCCFIRISNYKELIRKITTDSFGNIYYTTKKGVYVIKKGFHSKVKISSDSEFIDVTVIKQIKGNLYWAGTTNGFVKLKRKNDTFEVISKHGSDFIYDIIQLKNRNYIFAGAFGNVFITRKNKIKNYNFSEKFFNLQILSVTEDYQVNIWFATSLGLIKMFENELECSVLNDLIQDPATAIVKGKGNTIYFGTPNGLVELKDNKTRKFSISNEFISALTFEKNQLLVGTLSNKVFSFKDGKFQLVFHSPQIPTCIYRILNPSEGEYWIAASNDIVHLKNNKKKTYHISESFTQDIYLDKDGKLWFANMSDIGYIQNGQIHRLNSLFKKYDNFATIVKDQKDVMWIGTYGSGILRYHNGKITPISIKKGLSNNFVSATFYDPQTNILWVGTMCGISKINLNNKSEISSVTNYLNGDNLASYGCNQNAIIKLNNNRLLFGVAEELFEFNKSSKQIDHNNTKLVLSKLKVNDFKFDIDKYNLGNAYQSKQLQLESDQNNLDFSFSTIDFHNPYKVKYKWKLDGYDKNWHQYTNRNFISFTNLPSGDYTLFVKSINQTGQHSNVLAFNFLINKPFYFEIWFIILALVITTFSIYVFFQNRIRKIQRIEAEKTNNYKRLAEAELKSLRAQMNPHFMFNTLNAIQEIVLSGDEKKSRIYFADFAKMMRMILVNSAEKFITFEREIEFLKLYLNFELIRFQGKFKLNFKVDNQLEPHSIKIPGMLLQPIIENAINHGLLHKNDGGILDIHFYESYENNEERLFCVIQDNGVGIKTSEPSKDLSKNHRSMSSEITKERIHILNSLYGENKFQLLISKSTDFENREGTKITLIIKID